MKRKELCTKVIERIVICKPEDFSYVTVGWLARHFGVSMPNLSRAFKREYGFTLQKYLIRIKMMRGSDLLSRRSDLTVKQVAERLDYNSTSHFIAIFKGFLGIPPGKLRGLAREGRAWPSK